MSTLFDVIGRLGEPSLPPPPACEKNFFRVLRVFRGSIADHHVVRARETYPDDAAVLRGEARAAARHVAAVSAGDFFELFFDDAVAASQLLGLTLTKRQETPMAGLPAHALDNYVSQAARRREKRSRSAIRPNPRKPANSSAVNSRASFRRAPRSPPTSSRPRAITISPRSRLDKHGPARRVARSFDRRIPSRERRQHRESAARPHRARSGGAADRSKASASAGPPCRTSRPPCTRCTRSARSRSSSELPGYHFDTATGAKTVMDTLGVLNLQGFGLAPLPPGTRTRGCAGLLRDGKSLREARESSRPPGIPQHAHAAARSRHVAQSGDLFLHPRHAGRLARSTRSTAPSTPRARVCSNAGSPPRRSISPRFSRRQALVGELLAQPRASRRSTNCSAPSATSRAFWAGCKIACAIRASSAACATPSRKFPALRAEIAGRFGAGRCNSPRSTLNCRNCLRCAQLLSYRARGRTAQRSQRRRIYSRRTRRRARSAAFTHLEQQDVAFRSRAQPSRSAPASAA